MQEQGAGKRWLRSFSGPILFWLPLCLLGTYLYLGLLRKFSELSPDFAENSLDMLIYREAGEAILAGNVPYRDFFIEYPPGSLLAFVPPAFFTTNQEDFATLFASAALARTSVSVEKGFRRMRWISGMNPPCWKFAVAPAANNRPLFLCLDLPASSSGCRGQWSPTGASSS